MKRIPEKENEIKLVGGANSAFFVCLNTRGNIYDRIVRRVWVLAFGCGTLCVIHL